MDTGMDMSMETPKRGRGKNNRPAPLKAKKADRDFLDISDDPAPEGDLVGAERSVKALEGVIDEVGMRPVSVPLENHKHELFCQRRAGGEGQASAYKALYRTKWPDKPASLLGSQAHIQNRIRYLQERAALEVGIDNRWVMTEAVKLVLECDLIDDIAKKVAVKGKALMDLAKLKGMIKDKTEISQESIVEFISRDYADRSPAQQAQMKATLTQLFGPAEMGGPVINGQASKPRLGTKTRG